MPGQHQKAMPCGPAAVLPAAPAWSFGGKHSGTTDLPGPGPGKYTGNTNTWGKQGWAYGPGSKTPRGPSMQNTGMSITDTNYIHPGFLSPEAQGPSYSFGNRHQNQQNNNPGPASYAPANHNLMGPKFKKLHATWGPPPQPRSPSAPPRTLVRDDDRRKPPPVSAYPGASFKAPYPPVAPNGNPGPGDYSPCDCSGTCCKQCSQYKGWSFGHRNPPRAKDVYPAPDYYHVGCSTIGAATMRCQGHC